MKTLLALSLFPDRNQTLLQKLTERFRVITFQHHPYSSAPGVHTVERLLSPADRAVSQLAFLTEWRRFLDFTREKLAHWLPDDITSDFNLEQAAQSVYQKALNAYWSAVVFRRLVERVGIDLVLGNADYSAYNRPIVLEARQLGIPTVDIQHGFSAVNWEAHVGTAALPTYLPFISEYVNLDNEIEHQIWATYLSDQGVGTPVHFVVNGTPNDDRGALRLSARAARAELGLPSDAYIVTVASSWPEARTPSMAVYGPLEELEYFDRAFHVLGRLSVERPVALVVKLHPTYAPTEIFRPAEAFLRRLAAKRQAELRLVTCEHHGQVLAASNVIMTPGCSSILWEGFLAGTPGLIYLASGKLDQFRSERLNDSSVLYRRGLLRYVFNEDELADAVRELLRPEGRRRYRQARARLKREFHIHPHSAEEKSERLCRWLEHLLEARP